MRQASWQNEQPLPGRFYAVALFARRIAVVTALRGKTGVCRSGTEAIVASWNVHRREEPPISGTRGAGTIFFGYCQARCTYCQNFSLSQGGLGHRVGPERLADMMLYLQKKRCHNLDLVTPTHFVPQILAALVVACGKGLRLPIVYNCAGYENMETLSLAGWGRRYLSAGCEILRQQKCLTNFQNASLR